MGFHAFTPFNHCSAGSGRCGLGKVEVKVERHRGVFIASMFTVWCCCEGAMWDSGTAEQSRAVQLVYRQKLWPISWSWILSRLVDVKDSGTLQATNRTHNSSGGAGRGSMCVSRHKSISIILAQTCHTGIHSSEWLIKLCLCVIITSVWVISSCCSIQQSKM